MNDRLPGKLPHEIWCKAFQLFPENQKALLGLVTSGLFHIMLGRRYENVEFRHSDSSQRTTDALQNPIVSQHFKHISIRLESLDRYLAHPTGRHILGRSSRLPTVADPKILDLVRVLSNIVDVSTYLPRLQSVEFAYNHAPCTSFPHYPTFNSAFMSNMRDSMRGVASNLLTASPIAYSSGNIPRLS
ncbi:hypothetical protein FA13DRAFT_522184 [Coprinellus micaceus]|uniref:Uncharacterized protein n=1 Tax=Coprinellus micaceus TaxID=71717 RepID=A0A4Y7T9E8_COPMI|nr:hypothetical protein FA13DRAFT_522184 [Coprinellus micaceus]